LFISTPLSPAQKLTGQQLPNDWTVVSMINKKPNATGGHFSIGYLVKHIDGREAFLKAIDFSRAFHSPDVARELQDLTATFNFERDLLNKCRDKNLDRVVRAIEDGQITIDSLPVPYLIFELANGDIRAHMDVLGKLDLAWTLRMLHHVAVGVKQLHSVGIAHQDLKPSNILVFDESLVSKLADLGRSAHSDHQPPHDNHVFAGAYGYAPPELLYRFTHPDFRQRRFGCDTFLLGNIILFALTRETMTAVLMSHLAPEHMPLAWTGTYEDVLPYLQLAFNNALNTIEPHIPVEVCDEIITMLRHLCEPDLSKRGHPRNHSKNGNNFSLERFVSSLNLLAYKAERNFFGVK
jgi:eukaryotic-like serine/threonine-protein kinase